MNRLTKKIKADYFFNVENNKEIADKDIDNDFYASKAIRTKLGQLEDIEEELGIDLITLFKAVEQQKIWTNFHNEIDCCDECEYRLGDIYIYFYWENGKHLVFDLKDYGKTWALTKEELEK